MLVVVLSVCGGSAVAREEPRRYWAQVNVLEGYGHGPQMCRALMTSSPPQCSGPGLVGWDWDGVAHESDRGVRWGHYRVTGTWDGRRLTVTEPPREPTPPDRRYPGGIASACPEPAGGWRAADPGKATHEAFEEATDRAAAAADFAGAWIDDRGEYAFDPGRFVLNLRFTGDLAAREKWIREVWGGALCVSGAERTEAERQRIQQELMDVDGMLAAFSNPGADGVVLRVWLAGEDLRRRLAERYGPGVVRVESVLRPVG